MEVKTSSNPRTKKNVNKKQTLRNREYYDSQDIADELYARSKRGENFTKLLEYIWDEKNIELAFRNIKSNNGSMTPGLDKKDIQWLASKTNEELVKYVRGRLANFQPSPVKRVEIPKENGKTRPLGIPTIGDRLIQQCILQVLEPICEAKFYQHSYGFRPNRGSKHAIARCYSLINKNHLYHVVDVDIKGFFDNINHGKLLKQMYTLGIRDKRLICIISKMIKAPIKLPNGKIEHPAKGTPQGGILSPLLANIVLNELDWWVASQWEEFPTKKQYKTGKTNAKGAPVTDNSSRYRAMRDTKLKEMFLVRYADDFKIFCRSHNDAVKAYNAVTQWISTRLKLEISDEKSRITNLKRSYTEFLGFKIGTQMKGSKRVVESHMCDKSKKKLTKQFQEMFREAKHQDKPYYTLKINASIYGRQQYYNTATLVSLDFAEIDFLVNKARKHALRKRGGKNGIMQDLYIKMYGESKSKIKYLNKVAVFPIHFVRYNTPINFSQNICNYTPEGRKYIHDNLSKNCVDPKIMQYLLNNPNPNQSVLFNDNRISLYVAQNGKCYVLGEKLEIGKMEVHHKTPKQFGGTDKYSNLVFVNDDIHKLIHMTDKVKMDKVIGIYKLDAKQLAKVNKLREMALNFTM